MQAFTIVKDGKNERVIKCDPSLIEIQLQPGETYIEGAYPTEKYDLDEEGKPVELPEQDPRRRPARKEKDPLKLIRALAKDLRAAGIQTANFNEELRR